jgi:DNA invertase Pin-like site-specific DNA recombinase
MGRKHTKSLGNSSVAVAYLRMSPREEDPRLGVVVQREDIEAWAERSAVTVVGWYEDLGVSGDTPEDERPAFLEALQAIVDHRAGILVVAKRDRFARGAVEAGILARSVRARGAVVHTADGHGGGDTAEDALMVTILDAAAEYDLTRIRQRTSAALRAKKARGELVGQPPWGFRVGPDGVHLEPEPQEERITELARVLRDQGETIRAIAELLAAQGYKSRGKKPLAHQQVSEILKADAERRQQGAA